MKKYANIECCQQTCTHFTIRQYTWRHCTNKILMNIVINTHINCMHTYICIYALCLYSMEKTKAIHKKVHCIDILQVYCTHTYCIYTYTLFMKKKDISKHCTCKI